MNTILETRFQDSKTIFLMKYDVFISYSRKDYVDINENIIKGNVISRIKELFKEKGISYWFDEEGIFTGEEFAGLITRAIRKSRVFLFISSVNSNASPWTSNEIAVAYSHHKPIIPFRLDDTPYNDSVMMRISALDYITYKDNDKALTKLITAINYWINHEAEDVTGRTITLPDNVNSCTVLGQDGDEIKEKNYQADSNLSISENSTQQSNKKEKLKDRFINFFKKNRGFTLVISLISLLLLVCLPISYSFLHQKHVGKSTAPMRPPVSKQTNTQNNKILLVDLGLPSGTLWADRNLGANSPNDTGDQYAWGEITTKTQYSYKNYSCKDLSLSSIIGNPKYDPAVRVNMQMPSAEQFKELLNHCSWLWIESYGKNGFRVRGKNGKSIFLPVTGWKASDRYENTSNCGYYWSGDAIKVKPNFAKELLMFSNGKRIVGDGNKYYGRSIRPVASKK